MGWEKEKDIETMERYGGKTKSELHDLLCRLPNCSFQPTQHVEIGIVKPAHIINGELIPTAIYFKVGGEPGIWVPSQKRVSWSTTTCFYD